MGTNSTGCTEWERDYDHITEQPYKASTMELIVMRLADMTRVHPDQILGKCASCGHVVAIYPSGQLVIKQRPDTILTCQVCKLPGPNAALAPGAELEPFESVKRK